jgi:hypothetical protein
LLAHLVLVVDAVAICVLVVVRDAVVVGVDVLRIGARAELAEVREVVAVRLASSVCLEVEKSRSDP